MSNMEFVRPGSVNDILTSINKNFSIIHNSVLHKGVPGSTGPAGDTGPQGSRGNLLHLVKLSTLKSKPELASDLQDVTILSLNKINDFFLVDEKRIKFIECLDPKTIGLISGDMLIIDGSSELFIYNGSKFYSTGFNLNPTAGLITDEIGNSVDILIRDLFDKWKNTQTNVSEVFKEFKSKILSNLDPKILYDESGTYNHKFYGFNVPLGETSTLVAGDTNAFSEMLKNNQQTATASEDFSTDYNIISKRIPGLIVLQNDYESGLAIGLKHNSNHGLKYFGQIFVSNEGGQQYLQLTNKFYKATGSDNNTRRGRLMIGDHWLKTNTSFELEGMGDIKSWFMESRNGANNKIIVGEQFDKLSPARTELTLSFKDLVFRKLEHVVNTMNNTIPGYAIPVMLADPDTSEENNGIPVASPKVSFKVRLANLKWDDEKKSFLQNVFKERYRIESNGKLKSPTNKLDDVFTKNTEKTVGENMSGQKTYAPSDTERNTHILGDKHLQMIGYAVEEIRKNNDLDHQIYDLSTKTIIYPAIRTGENDGDKYYYRAFEKSYIMMFRNESERDKPTNYINYNNDRGNVIYNKFLINSQTGKLSEVAAKFGYNVTNTVPQGTGNMTKLGITWQNNVMAPTSRNPLDSANKHHFNLIARYDKINKFYGLDIPPGYVPMCTGFIVYYLVPANLKGSDINDKNNYLLNHSGFLSKNGTVIKSISELNSPSIVNDAVTYKNMLRRYDGGRKIDVRKYIAVEANKMAQCFTSNIESGEAHGFDEMEIMAGSAKIYEALSKGLDSNLDYEFVYDDPRQTFHNLTNHLGFRPGPGNPVRLFKYNKKPKEIKIGDIDYKLYHIFYQLNSVTDLAGLLELRPDSNAPNLNDIQKFLGYEGKYGLEDPYLPAECLYMYNNVNRLSKNSLHYKNGRFTTIYKKYDTEIISYWNNPNNINKPWDVADTKQACAVMHIPSAQIASECEFTQGKEFEEYISGKYAYVARNAYHKDNFTSWFNRFHSKDLRHSLQLGTLPFTELFTAQEIDPYSDGGQTIPVFRNKLSYDTFPSLD